MKISYGIVLFSIGLGICAGAQHGHADEKKDGISKHNVKVGGDLRYRHERIDLQAMEPRSRHRVRARVKIGSELDEYVNVGVQFATGTSDPVSTNQTLDGDFSSKPVVLDLAYFEYNPIQKLVFSGGKVKNPFINVGESELIWDSDLNPEGGYVSWKTGLGPFSIQPVAGSFVIDEKSSEKDAMLQGGQLGLGYKSSIFSVLLGGGVFEFTEAKNKPTFVDPEDGFGNSANADKSYMYDYKLTEYFMEIGANFGSIPISIFYDAVVNSDPKEEKTGWFAGISVGKAKEEIPYKIYYRIREVEKDAVIGAFTDSDFIDGGTNGKGHEVGAAYALTESVSLALTYFDNETPINDGKHFSRTQADLVFKF